MRPNSQPHSKPQPPVRLPPATTPPPMSHTTAEWTRPRAPEEVARAVRERVTENGTGANFLMPSLYSTASSLTRPSIMNTVKRARAAADSPAERNAKRKDYMTPPAPKRILDEAGIKDLLNKSHPAPASSVRLLPAVASSSPGPLSVLRDSPSPVPSSDRMALIPSSGRPSPLPLPSTYLTPLPGVNSSASATEDDDKQSPMWFIRKVLMEGAAAATTGKTYDTKEFKYLSMAKGRETDFYNPYNLRISAHQAIDMADYYTLSAKGVTHLRNGEADLTPLNQWLREHDIFHSLFHIPFFLKFRKWKIFYFWKKHLRRTTIDKYKEHLEENLFVLNKQLSGPLVQIRQACLDIQELQLYNVAPYTLPLDRYCVDQEKQREKAWKQLSAICARICLVVSDACKASMKAHTDVERLRDITDSALADSTAPPSTALLDDDALQANPHGRGGNGRGRGGNKVRSFKEVNATTLLSVTPTDQPYKQSYTELSQKRAECRRLTNYIRLADYMVIDSLVVLSMRSTREVLRILRSEKRMEESMHSLMPAPLLGRGGKAVGDSGALGRGHGKDNTFALGGARGLPMARSPEFLLMDDDDEPLEPDAELAVFLTEVIFKDDSLVITPNKEAFDFKVEAVVQGFSSTVCRVDRFLRMDEFRSYTDSVMAEHADDSEFGQGPDVSHMIVSEGEYKHLVVSIKEALGGAFREVEGYAAEFDGFKKMYLENRRMDTRRIRQEDPPLEWFREQMEKYKRQNDEVDHMRKRKRVALFLVDTRKLKEFFMPSPINCLGEIHRLLPVLAHEKNQRLLETLTTAVKTLNASPTEVEEFVAFLEFHRDITERMDSIELEYETVRDMYALIEGEGIQIPQEDKASYEIGTVPHIQKLRVAIGVTEDTKEASIRKFALDLDDRIEQLRKQLFQIHERSKDPLFADEDAAMDRVIDLASELQAELDDVNLRVKNYYKYQELFGVEVSQIDEILTVSQDVSYKAKLWTALRDWQKLTNQWTEDLLVNINPEEVGNEVNKYSKIVNQVSRNLQDNPVVPKLRALVDEFKLTLPVIQCLRNPALKPHHFQQIDEIVGKEIVSKEGTNFTLGVLIGLKVMDMKEEIQAVSNTATQEAALEELLSKVQKLWTGGGQAKPVEFIVNPYKDHKDAYVLGAVDDIVTQLEDSSITISTIITSRFCTGIRDKVEAWEGHIKYMSETLDKWLEFQRNWMYLESIFNSGDIARQWPQDAKTFSTVDKQWKELMKRVYENPSVYRILVSANLNLAERFDNNNKQLERILNNLEKKLEEKRQAFPRFYFLSNDDLLDILSQVKNPAAVQPHLLKMFDNIKKLEFGTNAHTQDIVAMESAEGESVPLAKYPKARGPVEQWLQALEQSMQLSLRRLAKICVQGYEKKRARTEWMFEHPVQLVLAVSQLFWCRGVERALEQGTKEAFQQFRDECYDNLTDLAQITARELNRIERGLLSTLITVDVHARDLVDQMRLEKVAKVSDFGWQKQLRTYWGTGDDSSQGELVLRQNNSSFPYGYEYQGCQPRLVITPLTDRIYMTITGALHLCLGGAPSGPAGTGKTETVKDLAKTLAIQCIVYNCSDGVTYKMMEKFFSGLAQCGAWCCLDEFNRINIEVLSVIAAQLSEIRKALLAKVSRFTFQGASDIELKRTFGAFITMNPGYAGRTELPDNLKVLFRPVAVMTPDFRMIAEVILFSEGFRNAKPLSLKITQLFKLSSEQLSPQDHYDFGMRALKSILVMAGGLKRSNAGVPEDYTLIRACRDSNIPKFVEDDIPLFNGILSDLFPGIQLPRQDYGELQRAIDREVERRGLQRVERYNVKLLQFYETLIVRHGVMLVGPTGSGKTVNRSVVSASLTRMREDHSRIEFAQVVREDQLNPKSITYGELYGEMNPMTGEWKDGVLALVAKSCVSEQSSDQRWIVFDGPVDTLWIESMNSVLDDSKLLCLDNGVRIRLPDTVRMVFEVQDLAVASPATVSRCGMVYMNPAELGWKPIVQSWLQNELRPLVNGKVLALLEQLINAHVQRGLTFVFKSCRMIIPTVEVNLVQSLCDLLKALLSTLPNLQDLLRQDRPDDETKELCGLLFCFCYVWSIGGNVDHHSMELFDGFARDALETVLLYPPYGSVYDFQMDLESRRFVTWESAVPQFKYDKRVPYFQILVPTVDTVRYSFLLKTLLQVHKPVLFNGNTGVGKSVIMTGCLDSIKDQAGLQVIGIQFSAQTSAARTQEMIEAKLKPKRKNVLGAPHGKMVTLFVDDLNMPAMEQFGAQPPIELLRQILGMGGFYDRKGLFWKHVHDVTLTAACGPPEGGRNPVTPRLVRFFHLLAIPDLAEDSMRKIFASILGGFLEPFAAEVRELLSPMVNSSVEIYQRIREDLRPIPAKAHYTFNLRDLSKVFQGMMQVVPRTCRTATTVTHLWIHENMRCFYDRLTDGADRKYFTEELMMDVLRRNFGVTRPHEEIFETATPILFGDFTRFGAPPEDRIYEEISDLDRLQQLFDEYLDEYNLSTNKQMSLVFFKDHCEHLCRIVRVIRQPRGNALLVGVGGSGKQSLTRLAASIAEYRCFQIEVAKNYSLDLFHQDLVELYKAAGVEAAPVVFLFSDGQIINETMLEDVNNMLNSGEVPNLLPPDEKEKCTNACLEAARASGVGESRDAVYSFFINRVRDNLHVVLCMSPVGDGFRRRCRQFPSLVNCCTIDWFDEWPKEALLSVSERLLEELEVGSGGAELKASLADMCVEIHTDVARTSQRFYDELRRHYYVTPASYLEFLSLYMSLLDEKRQELTNNITRIRNGKAKMRETNEEVDTMQGELTRMQPLLEEARKKTEAMMGDLSIRKERASEIRTDVAATAAEASSQQQVAQSLQAEAQRDLDEAMPELEAALRSLDQLSKNDIGEIRGYATAPKAVEKTMAAVLTILRESKTDWDTAKAILGDVNFIKRLREYDKDNIPTAVITRLKRFIDDPEFIPDKVGSTGSAACKSLCMWVRSMDLYYRVSRAVAPKKAALAQAQEKLDEMNAKLGIAQEKLQAVEDELAELQGAFDRNVQEKQDLEYKIELSSRRLEAASTLTASLSDEVQRWDKLSAQLQADQETLPGNVFLSAAFIAYLGAFTSPYRVELVQRWRERCGERGINVTPSYSLIATLADPLHMLDWATMTLPTDSTSVENAVLVTNATSNKSRRWPLMIDPQGQALKWIQKMEAKYGLKAIRLTDATYLRTLEQAIRNGTPVVIEDLGEALDPALEPVLLKQVYTQGGRTLINLGGPNNAVDYDPMFRLYLTTKLPNPHYLPDVCIKVTLINFTVTMQGLEEQLLGDVVSIERAELEETKTKIIQSVALDNKKLKQYENQILDELESATGNILDNQRVIDSLKKAQTTSELLSKRLKEAEEKSLSINEARNQYRTVAVRASVLYFVVAEMALIDPMYQYSLEYFKKLFRAVVEQCPKHAATQFDQHLRLLVDNLTLAVYSNITRGLFAKDKTLFAFLIAVQVLRQRGSITEPEWQFLLRSGLLVQPADESTCPHSWLQPRQWATLAALCRSVPRLQPLQAEIGLWRDWLESSPTTNASEKGGETAMKLPKRADEGDGSSPKWEDFLTAFQRCLVVKALREDRLVASVVDFIRCELGPQFTDPPPFDMAKALEDSSAQTPVIFVLSPGADPAGILAKFAAERGFGDRTHSVSLGQGQGDNAKRVVELGKKMGDWVLLQNCHLSKSFMPELERQVALFSAPGATVNASFRLWLTSMPSDFFPIPVLQNSIKLTTEIPTGLRANLARCYAEIKTLDVFTANDKFTECTKETAYHKLLFGLCFFHSIIQERKKFGPLGWNVVYEWNDTDLDVSNQWLQMFLREQPEVPWDALRYVIGEIVYGGRVTDSWDRRTLLAILSSFLKREALVDEGHSYSKSGTYRAPPVSSLDQYKEFIAHLPRTDDPEVFGMHDNANITYQLSEARLLIDKVLSIQPRTASKSAGAATPEEIVTTKAKEIEALIPDLLLAEEAGPSTFRVMENGLPYSLSTVLSHEMQKFNTLLTRIRTSLQELQKALQGLTVLSDALDRMFEAFLNNKVPALWAEVGYASLKPLATWVRDLIQRVAFVRAWLRKGEPPVFWMSGFFYPHGFMTGVLQAFARQFAVSVDVLGFSFQVLDLEAEEITQGPEAGVYISGLWMDSCRWNPRMRRIEDAEAGASYAPIPVIHFLPEVNHTVPDRCYVCPLYKTTVRKGTLSSLGQSTNFILAVELPSHLPEEYWIQKGAALVCSLND